jgi:hypothetical protein
MPKAIPEGLTAQHVLLALQDLDEGIENSFGPPTGYELVHDDKRHPPKAVVGIAFRHLTGSILPHGEFSGGESAGQANFVLRNLGFTVEPIQPQHNAFITSRGFVLPDDSEDLSVRSWFNMWKPRRWPYNELEVGDTLFWYDSQLKKLVWKTRVTEVARFEYGNKGEARERLLQEYGDDPIDDPYFAQASDHGYCLAFKVRPLERLNLSKPADYTFPYGGWLRCENPDAKTWLSQLPTENQDGNYTPQLRKSATKADNEGYFEPGNLEDERERKLREIVQRRGQPEFRNKLVAAYDGRCAVTGCDAVSALEAAHITPYLGPESNHVANGLLLRADIHTLLDLNLIGIDPESFAVVVAEQLRGTCYEEMDGQELIVPDDAALAPSKEALQQRWESFN